MKLDSKQYAPYLFGLLALFVLRVIGQILVASDLAPYLPAMKEWQSGLLPYPVLLSCQIGIVALYLKICIDFSRGYGFFIEPRRFLAKPLWAFGTIYLLSMPVRYVIYMTLHPEARWLSGTIPIVLHMVLASFLLLVSHYQLRRSGSSWVSG